MKPPRLFVDQPLARGCDATLGASQAHYLRTVLRLGDGAAALAFNGRDGEWLCRVAIGRRDARLIVGGQTREQSAEPGPVLLFAPIKRPRMEWLVEKAVEIGAARLVPVLTERTVVRPESTARLRARVVEAAEQCGRLTVPALVEPLDLMRALDAGGGLGAIAFADEAGDAMPLGRLLVRSPPDALLIGPEGGFTAAERKALRARADIQPVGLGPRILRAETAALYALACWAEAAATGSRPIATMPGQAAGFLGTSEAGKP